MQYLNKITSHSIIVNITNLSSFLLLYKCKAKLTIYKKGLRSGVEPDEKVWKFFSVPYTLDFIYKSVVNLIVISFLL